VRIEEWIEKMNETVGDIADGFVKFAAQDQMLLDKLREIIENQNKNTVALVARIKTLEKANKEAR